MGELNKIKLHHTPVRVEAKEDNYYLL